MADLRKAIPEHCFKKDVWRSVRFLARDVVLVAGLAFGAHQLDTWWVWPAYWLAQGTMFWALFVVGHDCGHQSFSNSKKVNNLVGNITHSSILVPYHGWRISHRMHHTHHGHVENDESWYPIPEKIYKSMDSIARIGRLTLPWALLAYPFYLWKRTPGKTGSHYDPECDLFTPNEAQLVHTSNRFLQGMLAVLAGCTLWLGPMAMLKLYVMPYWFNVMWLMLVTYLHHHGPSDKEEKMPWYRGQDWSYLRDGLTTLDRDYGMFNKIHHDIGTHVLHHLFPQMPHYHLEEATAAVKPVMGDYYREPEKSKGPIPFHLLRPLIRSFSEDHYVADTGSIVYYQKDAGFSS